MSVDHQLRLSYDRWREAFYTKGIETTPAYDVVGLLAALSSNGARLMQFFKLEGDPQPMGSKVIRLKEEHRRKESLASIFADMSPLYQSKRTKLLIITDFGEETDDEVTCLLAARLNEIVESNCKVKFLFTTKPERYQFQKEKFYRWGGSNASSIYEENEVLTWFDKEEDVERVILQIGPIHEPEQKSGWRTIWRPKIKNKYRYLVVGVFLPLPALNVSGNSGDCAKHLMSLASEKFVVDTMAGAGAFKFSSGALNVLFPPEQPWKVDYGSIQEHVCKIGWRNSVGRADPFPAGKFVAHLVSTPSADGVTFEGGANYMTALKIHEDMGGGDLAKNGLTANERARLVSEKYLDQLQHRAGPAFLDGLKLKVNPDGSTNSKPGVTAMTIVNGYEFILKVLNYHFGVPCEFFVSGKPENWKPEWSTPSLHDKAHMAVKEFALLPNMIVSLSGEGKSQESKDEDGSNAFVSGIPAGSALVGIGQFTKGLAIQIRSHHPKNTILLNGHYKLLNSQKQLQQLLTEHMPVEQAILKAMIAKLSNSKSRRIEKVVNALLEQVDPANKEIIEKTMLSTKEWRLISTI